MDDEEIASGAKVDVQRVRRLVVDDRAWRVYEIPAPQFDRRSGTHLIFESVEIVRRVRVFPANWYELEDRELYEVGERVRE